MSKKRRTRRRRYSRLRFKITFAALTLVSIALFYIAAVLIVHYFKFSREIALRLEGERLARPSWVYARPFELRTQQRLLESEFIELLNSLRYQRTKSSVQEPGTFYKAKDEIRVHLTHSGKSDSPHIIGVRFWDKSVQGIREFPSENALATVGFEAVPVTTLFGEERSKQRWVSLEEIPPLVIEAVLATEDRRFFEHTGLDPVGIMRAAWLDIKSGEVKQGGSTLSQQLVKNYFLTPERTVRRKALEVFLAIILESRASKEEILQLYLNDVYLGQRGSFGINGVGQAAKIYFGKDVKNLELEEAALLAALIRAPNATSPFRHADKARARRDIVLDQMARHGFIERDAAEAAAARPLRIEIGAVDVGEAPYFIDALREELFDRYPPEATVNLTVHSTMDRYLQTAAQRAVADGLTEIGEKLSGKNKPRDVQAALIVMEPSRGDVLALVGGRKLRSQSIQPGDRSTTSAGKRLQALRLPRRFRAKLRVDAHRWFIDPILHARQRRARRAHDDLARRKAMAPVQLRSSILRRRHLSSTPWLVHSMWPPRKSERKLATNEWSSSGMPSERTVISSHTLPSCWEPSK